MRRPPVASGRQRLLAGSIDSVVAGLLAGALLAVGDRLGLALEREGERELGPLPEPGGEDFREWFAALRRRSDALRDRPRRLVRRDGEPVPHDRALIRLGASTPVALLTLADLRRPSPLPGRRVVGLEVARADGRPLRPVDAIVRQAAPTAVSALWGRLVKATLPGRAVFPARLALTVVLVTVQLRDPEHRHLGDLVAGTRLVAR